MPHLPKCASSPKPTPWRRLSVAVRLRWLSGCGASGPKLLSSCLAAEAERGRREVAAGAAAALVEVADRAPACGFGAWRWGGGRRLTEPAVGQRARLVFQPGFWVTLPLQLQITSTHYRSAWHSKSRTGIPLTGAHYDFTLHVTKRPGIPKLGPITITNYDYALRRSLALQPWPPLRLRITITRYEAAWHFRL